MKVLANPAKRGKIKGRNETLFDSSQYLYMIFSCNEVYIVLE